MVFNPLRPIPEDEAGHEGSALESGGLLDQDMDRAVPIADMATRIATRALHLVKRSLTFTRTPPPSSPAAAATDTQVLPPTAWLAGLRGVAALIVVNLHHMEWGHVADNYSIVKLENAFGWEGNYHFAALPFVRIFFTGGHMTVPILFIISGYVLSARPLQYIYEKNTAAMASNLSSAFFRRWFRLFIPIFFTTFLWATSWHLFGIQSQHPEAPAPEGSWFAEMGRFLQNFLSFSWFGSEAPATPYNEHTWAIPEEYRGSLIVYATVLALSQHTPLARLACECGLLVYLVMLVQPTSLFVSGLVFCEVETMAKYNCLPKLLHRIAPTKQWVWWVVMLLGLYMGGVPGYSPDMNDFKNSPGWYLFYLLVPPDFPDFRGWYRFWGANFTFIGLSQIPSVRRRFEWRPFMLLGRLSYALYLLHGPVLWSIGDRLYAIFGRGRGNDEDFPGLFNLLKLPSWGPTGMELNFIVPFAISVVITLVFSELVTTYIDIPSAKFAQWLYKKGLDTSNEGLLGDKTTAGIKITVEEVKSS